MEKIINFYNVQNNNLTETVCALVPTGERILGEVDMKTLVTDVRDGMVEDTNLTSTRTEGKRVSTLSSWRVEIRRKPHKLHECQTRDLRKSLTRAWNDPKAYSTPKL